MFNINLFIDEFPKHKRTRLREATSDEDLKHYYDYQLSNTKEGLSKLHKNYSQKDEVSDLLYKVKVLSSCGKQNIKIKLKQNDALPGPKVCNTFYLAVDSTT